MEFLKQLEEREQDMICLISKIENKEINWHKTKKEYEKDLNTQKGYLMAIQTIICDYKNYINKNN